MSFETTRTIHERQQDLDDHISRLVNQDLDSAHVAQVNSKRGRELSELKRKRNDLSSIFQLPTDVMIIIFSMCTERLAQDRRWTGLPDLLRLGHVCQVWRNIALNSPILWTVIQIRTSTKPEFLQFQLEKSKQALLTVDYQCELKDPPNLDLISEIISDGAQRIRSLTIRGVHLAVQRILKASYTALEELEVLDVGNFKFFSQWNHRHDELLGNGGVLPEYIFPSSIPKLRTFDLLDYTIPWHSPVLASPNLTSLLLGSYWFESCQITHQYTTQLLSFLRHSPQLQALGLAFPITRTNDTSFEANWAPVELPNLIGLIIRAGDTEPFTFILPQLVLGPGVAVFHLSAVRVSADAYHSAVHKMLSCSQKMRGRLVSPQQVLLAGSHTRGLLGLLGVSLNAWKTASVSSGPYTSRGPSITTRPWASLTVDVRDIDPWGLFEATQFPLTSPWDPNLDWWFSNVRTLIIHNIVPSAEFWTMLSTRTTIQFLSFTLAAGDSHAAFYDALCGKARGSHSAPSIPFPSLRTLQLGGNYIHRDALTRGIYADTLDALLIRRSTFRGEVPVKHPLDLEEVIFVNCSCMVTRESLERILAVADRVAWHELRSSTLPSRALRCTRNGCMK